MTGASDNDQKVIQEPGIVTRVVDDVLAYVRVGVDRPAMLTFCPDAIPGYAGEPLAECGIVEGRRAEVSWKPASGTIVSLTPETGALRNASGLEPLRVAASGSTGASQIELLPDAKPVGRASVHRALSRETRQFGKLIDTSTLRPGDLLLTRDLDQDLIGKLISGVQKEGGYADADARWCHAAMYVGDGAHVVEATFDSPLAGGDVRLTSLDDYCHGIGALRFRRSRYIESGSDGWKLCVRAMSRLRRPYDFGKAVEMWFKVVIRQSGFFDKDEETRVSKAVICSTLYSDSYNEATRRSLGEVSGACTPAWLSVSDEFQDLPVSWLQI